MFSKEKNASTHLSFQNDSTTLILKTNNGILSKAAQPETLTQKSSNSPTKNLELSKASLIGSINSMEKPENATPSENLTIRQSNDGYLLNSSYKTKGRNFKLYSSKNSEKVSLATDALPNLKHYPLSKSIALKDFNTSFQKESFQTLLSYFKDSTTTHPGQMFSGIKFPIEENSFKISQSFHSGRNIQNLQDSNLKKPLTIIRQKEEQVNHKDKNENSYIEKIFLDLFEATVTFLSAKALDKEVARSVSKKKEDYWKDVLIEHEPMLIEILVIDIIGLVIKKHIEISYITPQGVVNQIDEQIRETCALENQAVQFLVKINDFFSFKLMLDIFP